MTDTQNFNTTLDKVNTGAAPASETITSNILKPISMITGAFKDLFGLYSEVKSIVNPDVPTNPESSGTLQVVANQNGAVTGTGNEDFWITFRKLFPNSQVASLTPGVTQQPNYTQYLVIGAMVIGLVIILFFMKHKK